MWSCFYTVLRQPCLFTRRSTYRLITGEDLSEKERKKLQQEQMREWIKQQLQEKNRESAAEAYAEQWV